MPPEKTAWRSLFSSVRPLTVSGVLRDAAAGIQLASVNIPQALGYTRIAGTPVITGLYTLLLPPIAFAAFGSSRYLVVAADSATAAILAGGLTGLAPPGTPEYVQLATIVALLTGVFLLIARLLRLGFLADFLSRTVLVGFLTGVGFQVAFGVLGQILGVPTHARYTVMKLAEVGRALPSVHLPTLAVSATVLGIILALRRLAPKAPGALIAVVGAIAASARWNFSAHGIAAIGPVQGGLPRPGLSLPEWKTIEPLIGIAVSCAVMIIAQSAATARSYAERHNQDLEENMDLVGLSAANAVAAISGAFPVNGSPTQTAMVEGAGARSQMAQISTSMVVALVLIFVTKPLEYLPQCVLGAIVFLVAMRLINLRGLWSIREESPGEFAVAVMTAAVVVVWGVEQGIVLAMIASLLRIVHHSYHPNTGVMVVNDVKTWDVVPPLPGTVTQPGLVIYRFGAPLFYANASRFAQEIKDLATSQVKWVVVDAEAITHMDYSAARVVCDVYRELAARGVIMAFARVRMELQADMNRHHLLAGAGCTRIYRRLHDARADYAKEMAGAPSEASLRPENAGA
ncbi:MAG: SulP family inorganic anion transporter [Silvibacterium sp.]|nr:SulP family inorganic anion transporter [Silvibacterium sp.]